MHALALCRDFLPIWAVAWRPPTSSNAGITFDTTADARAFLKALACLASNDYKTSATKKQLAANALTPHHPYTTLTTAVKIVATAWAEGTLSGQSGSQAVASLELPSRWPAAEWAVEVERVWEVYTNQAVYDPRIRAFLPLSTALGLRAGCALDWLRARGRGVVCGAGRGVVLL